MAKNWETLFPGIRKSVMAFRFPDGTSEEEKTKVFNCLVRVLLDKSVVKPNGVTYRWRSGCLDYLMDVLPRLSQEDVNLLLENKEAFYKKFCFTPSKTLNSLYSVVKKREKDGRFMTIPVVDLFERYQAEVGLSPYELPEQEGTVTEFLGTIVDDNNYFFNEEFWE